MSAIITLKNQVLQQLLEEVKLAVTYTKKATPANIKYQDIKLNLSIEKVELDNKGLANNHYNIDFKLQIFFTKDLVVYEDLTYEVLEKILDFLTKIEYNFYCSLNNHHIKAKSLRLPYKASEVNAIEVNWQSNLKPLEEPYH